MFTSLIDTLFAAVALLQLGLGLHRAHLLQESSLPALALSALFAGTGLLWSLRRRGLWGGFLARPAALLFATVGVASGLSAVNAPFLGGASRFSVPLLALSMAALLVSAKWSARAQIVPLLAYLVAVASMESVLMHDARWESARQGEPRSEVPLTKTISTPARSSGRTGDPPPTESGPAQ